MSGAPKATWATVVNSHGFKPSMELHIKPRRFLQTPLIPCKQSLHQIVSGGLFEQHLTWHIFEHLKQVNGELLDVFVLYVDSWSPTTPPNRPKKRRRGGHWPAESRAKKTADSLIMENWSGAKPGQAFKFWEPTGSHEFQSKNAGRPWPSFRSFFSLRSLGIKIWSGIPIWLGRPKVSLQNRTQKWQWNDLGCLWCWGLTWNSPSFSAMKSLECTLFLDAELG